MENQIETQRAAFREEAYELLSELENALLELEETPDNADLIGRVFRAMHTVKGSGAMFGFDRIAEFTHEVETVYDLVRDGKMAVTKTLIDLSLKSGDLISQMLAVGDDHEPVDPGRAEVIVTALKALIPSAPGEERVPAETLTDRADDLSVNVDTGSPVTYRIRFKPSGDLFANGTNPILLLAELAELGECRIFAHTTGVPLLDEIEPEVCYVFWDILLTTPKGLNAIKDVFIFVEDTCDIKIQVIDQDGGMEDDLDYKRLGQILVERGDLTPDEINEILNRRKFMGEMLVEAKILDEAAVESALAEQQHVREIRRKRLEAANIASIRVDAARLDSLVDLVGELVTVQARLSQEASLRGNSTLLLIAEEVERLSGELRDNAMSIRMLPIGATFSKLKRLVRDLSAGLEKEVALKTEGAETELDKTVIEQLNDPLVHIIRNSIDHGIEPPEARIEAGKPRQGTVTLKAAHAGADVLIRVVDDGAGLDARAIKANALAKGLIQPDAELTESDIFGLIFAPGFSTAETVSEVSGRGVGMDVVKKSVENLRGSIDVTSAKGKGTTITLKLPLTLAIIDGFMVKVGDGFFVFPLAAVEECVEMTRMEADRVRKRNMVNIRGAIVPYQSLRDTFGVDGALPDIEQIVVVEFNGQRIGFGVDSIIGQHQTVIKSLGKIYKDIKGISGATILGDGTVALILDVIGLINAAECQR